MLYGVYSMHDSKTGFMSPVIDVNDDSAIRNFAHTVANSDGILRSFAQDFQLYRIANFDSNTGIVDPVIPPVALIVGSDAMRMSIKDGEFRD